MIIIMYNQNNLYLCKRKDSRGVATRRQGQTDSLSLLSYFVGKTLNVGSMNKEQEIWKPVVGFEGSYEVSNLGQVRSLDRVIDCKNGQKLQVSGCVKKTSISPKTGYEYVMLNRNRRNFRVLVHRIVAKAFIPNPENKPCIDHINTNRVDNRVENLRWVTYKENFQNPLTKVNVIIRNNQSELTEKRLKKLVSRNDKYSPRPIAQICNGEIVKIWRSTNQATLTLGSSYNSCTIKRRCNAKHGSYKGYVWLYLTDVDKKLIQKYYKENGTAN